MPKILLGQAIAYSSNQWEKLTAFLKDGRLEIDNNRSERSIKPFVIGRKNWMFANTPRGAAASAAIYSVIETAKEKGCIRSGISCTCSSNCPSFQICESPMLWKRSCHGLYRCRSPAVVHDLHLSYTGSHLTARWGLFDVH